MGGGEGEERGEEGGHKEIIIVVLCLVPDRVDVKWFSSFPQKTFTH